MYEDKIIEAWESPQFRGLMARPTSVATCKNIECGDEVTIAIRVIGGIIEEARHESKGCVLCAAGAELLCQDVTGGGVGLITAGLSQESAAIKSLYGGLPLPNRLSCCLLPLRTLKEALNG